jgi:hypothetical protein
MKQLTDLLKGIVSLIDKMFMLFLGQKEGG